MNRRKPRFRARRIFGLCAMLLALCLAAVAGADGTVEWGMDRDAVTAALGEPDVAAASEAAEPDSAVPGAAEPEVLTYYGQRVSRFEDAAVSYFFTDGCLRGRLVHLGTDPGNGRFMYLAEALKKAYGEEGLSAEAGSRVLNYFGLEMGESSVDFYMREGFMHGWTAADGTEIVLFRYVGEAAFTAIFYLSPASE